MDGAPAFHEAITLAMSPAKTEQTYLWNSLGGVTHSPPKDAPIVCFNWSLENMHGLATLLAKVSWNSSLTSCCSRASLTFIQLTQRPADTQAQRIGSRWLV